MYFNVNFAKLNTQLNYHVLPIYFILFFKIILLLFNYSCLHFSPITPPHPCQTHHPPFLSPSLLVLSMCPLQQFLKTLPPIVPSCSPLAVIRFFLTSVSLVIFCVLFSSVDYVPVKGETIWYFSLTTWLISLSIMLSSSIHAVAKGRSSFFLCAEQYSIM